MSNLHKGRVGRYRGLSQYRTLKEMIVVTYCFLPGVFATICVVGGQ